MLLTIYLEDEMGSFGNIITQMLQDVKQRLVYRAQV